MLIKPRRNRKSVAIRSMVQQTRMHCSDLVYPLFVQEGKGEKSVIQSLPGIFRFSIDTFLLEIERAAKLGIVAFALFPKIAREKKCEEGKEAYNPEGLIPSAIKEFKRVFPDLCLISDVALDPYSIHGHDGVIDQKGDVLNEATIEILIKMALIQAEAGVDMIAPSDMMDGRIGGIRRALDQKGFSHVSILSYAIKYASSLYSPFREACGSHLAFGDKKGYQMDPANQREALLEAWLDEQEGADILMVKPALFYLDVITKLRERTHLPLSAYQVSGEYAMIAAAAKEGWLDFEKTLFESVLSIKRAGADMIFTYGAPQIASMLR